MMRLKHKHTAHFNQLYTNQSVSASVRSPILTQKRFIIFTSHTQYSLVTHSQTCIHQYISSRCSHDVGYVNFVYNLREAMLYTVCGGGLCAIEWVCFVFCVGFALLLLLSRRDVCTHAHTHACYTTPHTIQNDSYPTHRQMKMHSLRSLSTHQSRSRPYNGSHLTQHD